MTNTVRTAIAAVCAVLLAGCVSAPAYQPAPIAIAESTHGFKSVPVLGVTGTVETGETFYSESRVTSTQRYTATLLQPVKASMELGHSLVLDAGRSGALSKTVFGNRKALCWDFVTQAGVGGPAHACVVDSKDSGVFDQAMFKNRDRMFPIDMPARYEVTKLPEAQTIDAGGLRREVLYQGLSKGTIRVAYREFINDMARPAFTQDLQYDLDPDGTTIIVLKGLRVKVLKASGSTMTYTVQQPFA